MQENPMGIEGIEFLEYTCPNPKILDDLFHQLGLRKVARHKRKKISLYKQNDIHFVLNEEPGSFASEFKALHGPSICSMGWRVKDANLAFDRAVAKGAKPYKGKDPGPGSKTLPAVYGIGDSLIYFVDEYGDHQNIYQTAYEPVNDSQGNHKGLLRIDHLTNNVPKGEMQKWCDFYGKIFDFKEVRYFDIKGLKTGLISKVMVSPGYKIIIPINEPVEGKSQIQEYLEEYNGSGIQHVALLTEDIITTLTGLRTNGIPFLDVPDTYYREIKNRLPQVSEDINKLKELKILVDGDEDGYLLQIFSKNVIGPIFYEIIQRKNHMGFGEGNFQALFDAIERDQMERGYLK